MQIRGFENAIEKVEQKIVKSVENCFIYRSLHKVITHFGLVSTTYTFA